MAKEVRRSSNALNRYQLKTLLPVMLGSTQAVGTSAALTSELGDFKLKTINDKKTRITTKDLIPGEVTTRSPNQPTPNRPKGNKQGQGHGKGTKR